MHITYPKLGAALNATGRQIWYSCSWPVYESLGKPDCNSTFGYQCLPWAELTDSCNSWRIDKDIMDTFYLPGHSGVRNIIEHLGEANGTLAKWQRPGAINDPDMILIGAQRILVAAHTRAPPYTYTFLRRRAFNLSDFAVLPWRPITTTVCVRALPGAAALLDVRARYMYLFALQGTTASQRPSARFNSACGQCGLHRC